MTGLRHRHDLRQDQRRPVILDQAVVHVAPDEHGRGARRHRVGTRPKFARREKYMQLRARRQGCSARARTIEADSVRRYLTDDEKQIAGDGAARALADHDGQAGAGGLQALARPRHRSEVRPPTARRSSMRMLAGDAVISLAGETGRSRAGRSWRSTIDIALAPDGSTPTRCSRARRSQLTLPADRHGCRRGRSVGAHARLTAKPATA